MHTGAHIPHTSVRPSGRGRETGARYNSTSVKTVRIVILTLTAIACKAEIDLCARLNDAEEVLFKIVIITNQAEAASTAQCAIIKAGKDVVVDKIFECIMAASAGCRHSPSAP